MAIPYVPTTPEEMVEMLRLMRQNIPRYTQLTASDEKSLRRVAHVNPEWVQYAINAAGASTTLQNAIGMSSDELRQETFGVDRWKMVEAELGATLSGIHDANTVRKHRLGLIALQIYSIGRQLVRREEHNYLLPHIEQLKTTKTFGKGGTRKARATDQPPDPPAGDTTTPEKS